MKATSIGYILALGAFLGCKEPNLFSPYRDVGSFSSRVEAQNQALAEIVKNYGSLPTNKDYKVKYTNANALPSEYRQSALWYNKTDQTLKLELSIPDGAACIWKKVSRDVLEQAIKSNDGMLIVDSLSTPNQPTKTCLR